MNNSYLIAGLLIALIFWFFIFRKKSPSITLNKENLQQKYNKEKSVYVPRFILETLEMLIEKMDKLANYIKENFSPEDKLKLKEIGKTLRSHGMRMHDLQKGLKKQRQQVQDVSQEKNSKISR